MANNIRRTPTHGRLFPLVPMFERREQETVDFLKALVERESPSSEKTAVDDCLRVAAAEFRAIGGKLKWHRQRQYGDVLEVRFRARGRDSRKQGPILLLGHLDTVWPLGTLADMPFRQDRGRIWGPGALDMKAGVAMARTALAYLLEERLLNRDVVLLLNSEEEIGSPISRPITEAVAGECECVFVLEPGQGLTGAYKTSRKGTGDFTVRVKGVSAHAGVDFSKGHSAILELARLIDQIAQFTQLERGITVNPGVIGGGTQANVIALEAWVHVDFRFAHRVDARKLERKFRSLRPMDKQCIIEISGGVNRPPMERTRATAALFCRAATLAADMGFMLDEAATGGGSDGNFTSDLGIPTLDGMGAVGEGAHAANESILREHLAPRTALLAALIGGL